MQSCFFPALHGRRIRLRGAPCLGHSAVSSVCPFRDLWHHPWCPSSRPFCVEAWGLASRGASASDARPLHADAQDLAEEGLARGLWPVSWHGAERLGSGAPSHLGGAIRVGHLPREDRDAQLASTCAPRGPRGQWLCT